MVYQVGRREKVELKISQLVNNKPTEVSGYSSTNISTFDNSSHN